MTRSFDISIGEYYHVYNRGTDKRKVFLKESDYERFLMLLYVCNSKDPIHLDMRFGTFESKFSAKRKKPLVEIGAYCLMPSHFHLLLKEITPGGISLFMQKITTAYTMYFNKKNDRNGSLFQGTFKAKHLNQDEYLKYIFAYIHLNPVELIDPKWRESKIRKREAAEKFLRKYSYSSYFEYTRIERVQKSILSPDGFPTYFEKADDFPNMIKFWLDFQKDL